MSREVRDDQHGTTTGYLYGCRCEPCTRALTAYMQRRDYPAGTATGHEVRDFARSLGFNVGSRGQINPGLIDRWNRAHPERPYVGPVPR